MVAPKLANGSFSQVRVNIIQGEFRVTEDPQVVLMTILGSCVAACLWDPMLAVGGMNHFLLPGEEGGDSAVRHGVHAMELLVNGLLQRGARRERMQAKLFGGACMLRGLTDVGTLNASFAERFVKRERIAVTGGSLRGVQGRRINFWPATGRARQMMIAGVGAPNMFASERNIRPTAAGQGEVELF